MLFSSTLSDSIPIPTCIVTFMRNRSQSTCVNQVISSCNLSCNIYALQVVLLGGDACIINAIQLATQHFSQLRKVHVDWTSATIWWCCSLGGTMKNVALQAVVLGNNTHNSTAQHCMLNECCTILLCNLTMHTCALHHVQYLEIIPVLSVVSHGLSCTVDSMFSGSSSGVIIILGIGVSAWDSPGIAKGCSMNLNSTWYLYSIFGNSGWFSWSYEDIDTWL